jgi:hypothetical protein
MLSGAIIRLPDGFDIERLNGLRWDREEQGQTLKSIIQFKEMIPRSADPHIKWMLVIHETLGKTPVVDENNGVYSISYMDTTMPSWAYAYAVPDFIIVDKLENRDFVREIINKGLRLTDPVRTIILNTRQMSIDYHGQWIRGFADRRGRVQRGTVFGESVEQDDVFAPELERSTSKSVGWITNVFGEPVKVRVSPRGAVSVWGWPPIGSFLNFIRNEVLPYIISLD